MANTERRKVYFLDLALPIYNLKILDGGLFSAANIEKGMQLGMAAMAMKGGHKGYKNQMKYDMGMKAMKKFF